MTNPTSSDKQNRTEDSAAGLIARLEAAEAGSRELDAAIGELVGAIYCAGGAWPFAEGSRLGRECPHYTTSIDAALSLVPEGLWVEAVLNFDRPSYMEIHCPTIYDAVTKVTAPTPALALCIAALKARQP